MSSCPFELENGRLKNPYRFPKVKTNNPNSKGWLCFDMREQVWIVSISFLLISWISITFAKTQCAQGMCYYKKMVHEKFILFGQIWVHIIDLSHKWATSRVEVHKIIFFFKFFPNFFLIFSSILALLTNILTFFIEHLTTKLSHICQIHLIFAFK